MALAVEAPIKQSESPTRPVDQLVLDLLRRSEGLSVSNLMERLEVTATAIRQRLDRLENSGLIERRKQSTSRGRPSFNYFLTDLGWRQAGVTYSDLAIAMWKEIQAIEVESMRNEIVDRVSERMGNQLRDLIPKAPLDERMQSMASLMSNRKAPTSALLNREFPILEVQACPYPDLVGVGHDRSVCDLETKAMSVALGQKMELSQCRLDGHTCCQFKPA